MAEVTEYANVLIFIGIFLIHSIIKAIINPWLLSAKQRNRCFIKKTEAPGSSIAFSLT